MSTRASLTFKHSDFQTGLRAANSGIGPLFSRLPIQTITTTVHSTVLNSHALDVSFQYVFHLVRIEEIGVTTLKSFPEEPNEHSQECPPNTVWSRADGADDATIRQVDSR